MSQWKDTIDANIDLVLDARVFVRVYTDIIDTYFILRNGILNIFDSVTKLTYKTKAIFSIFFICSDLITCCLNQPFDRSDLGILFFESVWSLLSHIANLVYFWFKHRDLLFVSFAAALLIVATYLCLSIILIILVELF